MEQLYETVVDACLVMYSIMTIHISIPFEIDPIHRFLDGNRTTFGEAADKCIGQVIEWLGRMSRV